MPLIALAPCSALRDYEAALTAAGADIRRLDPAADDPRQVAAWADGLLLAGGGDVDPAAYGAVAHASFAAAEPGRDAFELALAAHALASDLPLLAVCRGIQVLNVACGGTLIQHIPDDVPQALDHYRSDSPVTLAHDVAVEPSSALARLLALPPGGRPGVNSRHHQAVARLGRGLRVSARAADGVVEAVEAGSRRFCVGVQWHPENFHRTGEFAGLFAGLVAAARRGR